MDFSGKLSQKDSMRGMKKTKQTGTEQLAEFYS